MDFGVFLASGLGKPSTDGRLSRRILQAALTVFVQALFQSSRGAKETVETESELQTWRLVPAAPISNIEKVLGWVLEASSERALHL